jgi:hypothetical protein
MMSYMPFKRDVQLDSVNDLIQKAGRATSSQRSDRGSGDIEYKDRLDDQLEIKNFLDCIFEEHNQGQEFLSFEKYKEINQQVSSEMFYALMAILHEQLPCARAFFKLKQSYREKNERSTGSNLS